MTSTSTRRRLLAVVVTILLACVGCTTAIEGTGTYANGVRPNATPSDLQIKGSDGGAIDQLAANSLDDIFTYWRAEFPKAFGKKFKELTGGIYSYTPAQKEQVPCVGNAKDAAGNAFYCPTGDLIAFDRDFLGQLADKYGDVIVTLVLAHEFGHAIQQQVGEPAQQSINIETQADCYAGVFVKQTTKGTDHFDLTQSDLDQVLAGYLYFRDAPGGSSSEEGSHGSGFDRISGFQEGFEKGAADCKSNFGSSRVFTEIPFKEGDEADKGNAPFDAIIELAAKENGLFWPSVLGLDASFAEEVKQKAVKSGQASCDGKKIEQLVAYCDDDKTIYYSESIMKQAYDNFGDYAVFELFTLLWADAALSAADKDLQGEARFTAQVCMSGGFAGDAFLLTQANQKTLAGSTLSAGDLDEALALLLALKSGDEIVKTYKLDGFARVSQFRKGFDLVRPGPEKVTGCIG